MQSKQNNNSNRFDFQKIFRKVIIFLPIGVLGNLLFSFFTTDRHIFQSLQHIQFSYLLLSLTLAVTPWFTHAVRMKVWTTFLDKSISFWELLKIAVGATLGAGISPTAVGGAPVKVAMLMQQGFSGATAVTLAIIGSVEDTLFFVVAIPIAITISGMWHSPIVVSILYSIVHSYIFYGVLISICITILLFRFNRHVQIFLHHWLTNLPVVSRIYYYFQHVISDLKLVYSLISRNGKRRFLVSYFFSTVNWVSYYMILFTLLLSLGIYINPFKIFVLQWFVFCLMGVIPTPGASGGAEASFFFIFHSIVPESQIGMITMLWRIQTFYVQLTLSSLLFLGISFARRFEKKIIPIKSSSKPKTVTVT
ncbi:flippase-like domain-containing protein [candidate division KSB1 bacterium]|nr:flippase-like domain-containing protein [candidate division KSB1 bacterium]